MDDRESKVKNRARQSGDSTQSVSERRRPPRVEVLPALCAVLDHLLQAVLLISPDSRLLFRNRSAQLLLNQPGAIKLSNGKLWIGGTPAATLVSDTKMYASRIMHGRQAVEHRLYVTRLGLRRRADPIALIVFAPHLGREVSVPLLRQLYRLTHAEATTAGQIFAGQRPTEVARHLGVTTHTVRAHIKRIFAKCEVRSQVELVRLVALGPGVS